MGLAESNPKIPTEPTAPDAHRSSYKLPPIALTSARMVKFAGLGMCWRGPAARRHLLASV